MAKYTKDQLEGRLKEVIAVYENPESTDEQKTRAKMMGVTLQETIGKKDFAPKTMGAKIDDFTEKVSGSYDKRVGEVSQTIEDYDKGEIGATTAAVQVAGKSAGLPLDVTADVMQATILPDEMPDWVGRSFKWAMGTDTAKMVSEGWNSLDDQTQKTIESVTNLFMLGAPTVKAGKLTQKLATKGELLKKKRLSEFFLDPLSDTTKGKQSLVKRNFKDTGQHIEMVNELATVKGLHPKKSYRANAEILHKELGASGNKLKTSLESRPVMINRSHIVGKLDENLAKLKREDVFLQSDQAIENAFNTSLKSVKKIIAGNDNTPAGLLKSRQEFDKILKKSMFDNKLEPTKRTAIEEASGLMRRTVNDLIDESVPAVEVKALLNRQHQIYKGIDSMAYQYSKQEGFFKAARSYAERHSLVAASALHGSGLFAKVVTNPLLWTAGAVGAVPYAAHRYSPALMSAAGKYGKYPAKAVDALPVSPVRGGAFYGKED